MQWACAISTDERAAFALEEAYEGIAAALEGATPDLVFAFATTSYAEQFDRFHHVLRSRLEGAHLIGCSADGIIGQGREVEHEPGISLVAALLPGVDVVPFHLSPDALPEPGADADAWRGRLATAIGGNPHFVVLPDPFSCDIERLLAGLDHAFPESVKVGGLPSGATRPGQITAWVDDDQHTHGVAGVMLEGNLRLDTLVAQGCRPIGSPMFVTRSEANLVHELDGHSPVEVLEDLYAKLPPADQERMRHSLFVGVGMHPAIEVYGRGDFLVRNLLGIESRTGGLAVGTSALEVGQVLQFQLRDAEASAEDLDQHLAAYMREAETPPAGGLLFSCLGRGQGLYGVPHHDARAVDQALRPAPIGGFFCAGEIGPVGGRTHLHGYTSALGLFRSRPAH